MGLNLLFNRLLPESAWWLMTQGRKEEALKELQRAARVNKKKVPEDVLNNVNSINTENFGLSIWCECFLKVLFHLQIEMETTSERRNVLDIFRISYLRKRFLIMGFDWCVFSNWNHMHAVFFNTQTINHNNNLKLKISLWPLTPGLHQVFCSMDWVWM